MRRSDYVYKIVSPLGMAALAANSFSVTAESLCYMPGHGIGMAATTLIGQSVGAKREDITKRLGWLTVGLGILVMTGTGILLYIFGALDDSAFYLPTRRYGRVEPACFGLKLLRSPCMRLPLWPPVCSGGQAIP